jgi:hypothetical protein
MEKEHKKKRTVTRINFGLEQNRDDGYFETLGVVDKI